ncbi:MAG: hypothetical protein K2Q01_00535 [Rickettsiales bacterium]|nr:hypothetical protein [Rickettsiales bacterium]
MFEAEMLDRMLVVRDQYQHVMQGFRHHQDEMQQHALIRFSDSLLDMMKLAHKQKGTA